MANDASTGSLDSFLLPALHEEGVEKRKLANHSRVPQTKRTFHSSRQPQQRQEHKRSKSSRNNFNQKDPLDIATLKVNSHLKTINRCQPASWLPPFVGKETPDDELEIRQHFVLPELQNEHENTNNTNKDNNELNSDQQNATSNQITTDSSIVATTRILQDSSATESQNTEINLENNRPIKISELLSIAPRDFPRNNIARRSEFFGKCRLNTKLEKTKSPVRKGRMGKKTEEASRTHRLTPRSLQISGMYQAGLIPRLGVVAEMGSDGVIHLCSRDLGTDHATILVKYLNQLQNTSSLKAIILSDNRIDDDTGSKIVRALQRYETLEILDMSNNSLGKMAAKHLGTLTEKCNMLHTLKLSGSMPGTLSTKTLMQSLTTKQIKHLDLSHNRISNLTTIHAIGDIISNSNSLEECMLGWNNFGPRGGLIVCRAMLKNRAVKKLDLAFNNIGDESLSQLAEAVEGHENLIWLDVSGNNFGDEAAVELVDAMRESRIGRTLNHCSLKLQHNHLSRSVADIIMQGDEAKEEAKASLRHKTPKIEVIAYPLVVGGPYQGSIDPVTASVGGY